MVMNFSLFYPVKRALGNMSATDLFFQITEETSSVNQNITILDLKDEYNRGKIAECLSTVDSLKPWIIGVDIIFEGNTIACSIRTLGKISVDIIDFGGSMI